MRISATISKKKTTSPSSVKLKFMRILRESWETCCKISAISTFSWMNVVVRSKNRNCVTWEEKTHTPYTTHQSARKSVRHSPWRIPKESWTAKTGLDDIEKLCDFVLWHRAKLISVGYLRTLRTHKVKFLLRNGCFMIAVDNSSSRNITMDVIFGEPKLVASTAKEQQKKKTKRKRRKNAENSDSVTSTIFMFVIFGTIKITP